MKKIYLVYIQDEEGAILKIEGAFKKLSKAQERVNSLARIYKGKEGFNFRNNGWFLFEEKERIGIVISEMTVE